jgi:ankyrin repeat protein
MDVNVNKFCILYSVRPIPLSIIWQQVRALQFILAQEPKIDLNACCKNMTHDGSTVWHRKVTPLMLAVTSQNTEMVRLILEAKTSHDFNSDSTDIRHGALDLAIDRSSGEIIKLLIDNGSIKCTFRHVTKAVKRHSTAVLSEMLRCVTSEHELMFDKEYLLQAVVSTFDKDKIGLVLEHGARYQPFGLSICSITDSLPLVLRNDHTIIQMLVEHGWNVASEGEDKHGYTLMDYATAMDWTDTIGVLARADCPCRADDARQLVTPYYAVMRRANKSHPALVRLAMDRLHERGYNINQSIVGAGSVIHHIVAGYSSRFANNIADCELIRKLIDLGADTNVQDEFKRTALVTAFCKGTMKVRMDPVTWQAQWNLLRLLVCNTAMTNLSSVDILPVHYSMRQLCRKWRTVTPLLMSVLLGCRQLVHLLLSAGYNVHGEDTSRYPTDDIYRDCVTVVTQAKSSPSSLFNLCRINLRRWYSGRKLVQVIENVHLPKQLQDFILLVDIDHEIWPLG